MSKYRPPTLPPESRLTGRWYIKKDWFTTRIMVEKTIIVPSLKNITAIPSLENEPEKEVTIFVEANESDLFDLDIRIF